MKNKSKVFIKVHKQYRVYIETDGDHMLAALAKDQKEADSYVKEFEKELGLDKRKKPKKAA